MSKEFEEWFDGYWPTPAARVNDEYDNIKAAFTAGRALGRREMKGEARGIAKDHDFPDHVDCDGCITARLIASAI